MSLRCLCVVFSIMLGSAMAHAQKCTDEKKKPMDEQECMTKVQQHEEKLIDLRNDLANAQTMSGQGESQTSSGAQDLADAVSRNKSQGASNANVESAQSASEKFGQAGQSFEGCQAVAAQVEKKAQDEIKKIQGEEAQYGACSCASQLSSLRSQFEELEQEAKKLKEFCKKSADEAKKTKKDAEQAKQNQMPQSNKAPPKSEPPPSQAKNDKPETPEKEPAKSDDCSLAANKGSDACKTDKPKDLAKEAQVCRLDSGDPSKGPSYQAPLDGKCPQGELVAMGDESVLDALEKAAEAQKAEFAALGNDAGDSAASKGGTLNSSTNTGKEGSNARALAGEDGGRSARSGGSSGSDDSAVAPDGPKLNHNGISVGGAPLTCGAREGNVPVIFPQVKPKPLTVYYTTSAAQLQGLCLGRTDTSLPVVPALAKKLMAEHQISEAQFKSQLRTTVGVTSRNCLCRAYDATLNAGKALMRRQQENRDLMRSPSETRRKR